jgi:hypothetical protein
MESGAAQSPSLTRRSGRAAALLFVAVMLVFGWFFQGFGFNQNAHFDTVRALIERRSFEITYLVQPLAPSYTGDVSYSGDRVYSSKPPGLALVCAPFYFVVYSIERACGVDPARPQWVHVNQYLTTLWGSALPGALLVVAMLGYFRRRGVTESDALILSAGFGFGSLLLPYAGMLMVHPLVALLLFAAWRMVDEKMGNDSRGLPSAASIKVSSQSAATSEVSSPLAATTETSSPSAASRKTSNASAATVEESTQCAGAGSAALAGALMGLGVLCDISVAPLVIAYLVLLFVRRRGTRRIAIPLFLLGPIVAAAVMMLYQHAAFGSATAASYSRVRPEYTHAHLYFGHFDLPDLRRLYWLTFHPLRGIFYSCPILIIPILSLFVRNNPIPESLPKPGQSASAAPGECLLPLAVIASFGLFNLTYHDWTGGYGVGPRYLIPAMAFLFIFAAPAFVRFRRVCWILLALSVLNMLAVTAVRAQFPANLSGPPIPDDPVSEAFKRLTMNQLARTDGSFNLGLLLGLKGVWSLVPPLAIIVTTFALAARAGRSNEARAGQNG